MSGNDNPRPDDGVPFSNVQDARGPRAIAHSEMVLPLRNPEEEDSAVGRRNLGRRSVKADLGPLNWIAAVSRDRDYHLVARRDSC